MKRRPRSRKRKILLKLRLMISLKGDKPLPTIKRTSALNKKKRKKPNVKLIANYNVSRQ